MAPFKFADNPVIIVYGAETSDMMKNVNTPFVAFTKEDYSEILLEKCIANQKNEAIVAKGCKHSIGKLIILDDVFQDARSINSDTMLGLCVNGRCMHLGCIICLAKPLAIHPLIAYNTDYLLICPGFINDKLPEIYANHFLSEIFTSFHNFEKIVKQCAHSCMVVVIGGNDVNRRGRFYMGPHILSNA